MNTPVHNLHQQRIRVEISVSILNKYFKFLIYILLIRLFFFQVAIVDTDVTDVETNVTNVTTDVETDRRIEIRRGKPKCLNTIHQRGIQSS